MNRIIDLERENIIIPEVLEKIVKALNLDHEYVNGLIKKDKEEDRGIFEEWWNQPIEMYYVMRLMPNIYLSYELPTNIQNAEEAVRFVAGIAKEQHNKCWVILSRKEKVYITEAGEVRGKIETKKINKMGGIEPWERPGKPLPNRKQKTGPKIQAGLLFRFFLFTPSDVQLLL